MQSVEVGVQLNYTLPFGSGLNARASGRYIWIPGECRCDGRPKGHICIDKLWNNRTVDPSRCSYEPTMKLDSPECKPTK